MEKSEKVVEAIKKTGYLLEFEISDILKQNGWVVINNRYYIDENKEREIDILAYKVKIIDDTAYYTTLIISCKKNEENNFCFFTKEKIKNDPNMKENPNLYWTNSKILMNTIKEEKNLNQSKFLNNETQVFAFQLIAKNNQKVQNDKPIYDSVISTIKAYEYEKKLLDKRKNNECFYDFNLISVCDTHLFEAYFEAKDNINVKQVDEIVYVNRHIIFGNEEFYRVHFISAEKFIFFIEKYNNLFTKNCNFYSELKSNFYKKLLNREEISTLSFSLLEEEFLLEINKKIFTSIWKTVKSVAFSYQKEKDILVIELRDENSIMNNLINTQNLKRAIKEALDKIYKYNGNFILENIFPF